MDFKKTLFRCITSVICVIALCFTIVSGVGKITSAQIEAAKLSGNNVSASGTTDDSSAMSQNDVSDSSNSDSIPAENTAADSTDSSAPSGETSNTAETPAANNGTSSTTPAAKTSSDPKTPEEIINYYNTATAKVVSLKPAYNKSRTTDNEKMDGSAGLKALKSLVYKFMGIGADNAYQENVTKDSYKDRDYLVASKLSASDVTSASCVKNGNNYVITLKLKSGSSSANKSNPSSTPNTALDKCGILTGVKDKGYYDHKNAMVIYDAIQGTYDTAEVSESYSDAVVVATVNSANGQITSLKVDWNVSVTLSKLLGMSATASGISHVNYKDFKY